MPRVRSRVLPALNSESRLSLIAAVMLCPMLPQTGAQAADPSVSGLAEREAARREQRLNAAGGQIAEADSLMRAGKTQEALAAFEAVLQSLPDTPLTHETRVIALSGYVGAGCTRAQELAVEGRQEEASQLLAKLKAASPADKRIESTRKVINDPDRIPPALTATHIANVQQVQQLLLKAHSYLELGDYDNANTTYQSVLRIDPTNSAARRGMEEAEQKRRSYFKAAYDHRRANALSKVDQLWEDQVPAANDLSSMFGAVSATTGGIGRESILQRLASYQMPNVEFQGATIDEVVELLRIRSRDLDPQGKGVDFVISLDDSSRKAAISLSMQNVPMDEVLRYVTEMAGVSFRVEPHAVVITSIGEKNSAMVHRSYRVPPDFIQNSATTTPPAGAPGGDPFATAPAAGTSGGLTLRRLGAKEFLESRGVQFPEGASASFSSGTSTLVVRNTVPNIEVVESLVEQALKQTPKLVTVTVRMLEVGQNNLDELGFDWLLGGGGSNPKVDFAGGTHGNAVTPNTLTRFPFSNVTTTAPLVPALPPVSTVTAVGLNPITSGLRTGDAATNTNRIDQLLRTGNTVSQSPLPAPGILSIAGVFTDPQFQTVLRGLNQKKGIDTVVSPSVTSKNGQKATVFLGREMIYPTEFDPPQLPQQGNNTQNTLSVLTVNGVVVAAAGSGLGQMIATPATPTAFEMRPIGVTLEVEPIIGEDGSVELNLAPTITDFEGFVDYGSPIRRTSTPSGAGAFQTESGDRVITENRILQPIFKTSKTATSVRVWDGSTIMLGGLQRQEHTIVDDKVPILGDIPVAGRLFRSHSHSVETKSIVFFVTVDVIDPSGRKIRRDQTAAVAP